MSRGGVAGAALRAAPRIALDDHWEWFRRVIEGRKEREGDPVIAILEQCLVEVRHLGNDSDSERLQHRLEGLLVFVRQFDHGLSGVLRADTTALRNLFTVVASLDDGELDRLFSAVATVRRRRIDTRDQADERNVAIGDRRCFRSRAKPAVSRFLRR